jgi:hypothetical protein
MAEHLRIIRYTLSSLLIVYGLLFAIECAAEGGSNYVNGNGFGVGDGANNSHDNSGDNRSFVDRLIDFFGWDSGDHAYGGASMSTTTDSSGNPGVGMSGYDPTGGTMTSGSNDSLSGPCCDSDDLSN